jgi:1-acyl-sn-glycerol-3-phosphate acyltransferase
MSNFLKKSFRVTGRLLWLAGEILLALLDFVINVMFAPKTPLPRARSLWLQQTCRRVLRIMKVKIKTQGPIPLKGLLVSNHLGYLDILVLSAVAPAVFIARSDVKRWPILGWFAILAGTLFVRRARRSDIAQLNREVALALDAGALVVLFPEDAGSDSRHVLRFRSSVLEPVARLDHPLSAASIHYSRPDREPVGDTDHSGDERVMPFLLKLLSTSRIGATVSFIRLEPGPNGRKELARSLHSQVTRLQESSAPVSAE